MRALHNPGKFGASYNSRARLAHNGLLAEGLFLKEKKEKSSK